MAGRSFLPMEPSCCDLHTFRDKKPTRMVVVPPDKRRRTHQREREANYRSWKLSTGCDVLAYGDRNNSTITQFGVFGAAAKSEQAVKEINEWIEMASTKTPHSTAWSKVKAFDPIKYGYDVIRAQDVQRREMFKGPLLEGTGDLFKVNVDWPNDLINASVYPKDVFGVDLSQLDPIRTGDEVFIVPIHGTHNFEILGFEARHIEIAEQHCINMIQKVQMNQFGSTHPTHIILDDTEGIDVQLEAAEDWWPNRTTHRIVPRMLPSPIMNEPGSFRIDGLHFTQLSIIQHNIQLALEAIRYDKAHYEFCVRYGCLALRHDPKHVPDSMIGATFPKARFLRGVNGLIDCEAKKWAMHDDDGDELLGRLKAAEDLLEPTRSADYYGHVPEILKDIRPIFRGTWVFIDPNAAHMARHQGSTASANTSSLPSLIVVRIEWTDDEDGMYEKGTPEYYRLRPGLPGPKEHMELKLFELTEGKAWQFSLESMTPVSRKTVSPALEDFARRVTMEKCYNVHSKERFAKITRDQINSMLKLQHSRLDKIFSFGIKKTCYKVELVGMWYPNQRVPCWGLNVRHKAWIDHLAELEALRPGDAARWGDVIPTFLPDDGGMPLPAVGLDLSRLQLSAAHEAPPRDGILLLTLKLMELSKIINNTGGVPVFEPAIPVQEPHR